MLKECKILIVDDMEANRRLLNEHVLHLKHKPILAENGMVALKLIEKYPPDIILLDIMMPELSGSQVLERLKSHSEWRHIPVIMISATDDTDTIVQCIQLGATDYLVKPFNPLILAARINNRLASKALRDQEDAYRREIEKYNQELEIRVMERTKELHASRREVIVRLGKAAEYRDNETGMHVIRMSQYSHLLAQKAGMNPKVCEMILQASPMHDVGKIGIPDNILLKPGKLNHDEWQTMKTHASIGADILAESGSDMLNMAETIARTHHEKYDGTGYPKGLNGEEIPIEGRIIAICDVFDALTSSRPYKKAWTVEEATNFINSESGKHFDPKLVSLFIEFLPEILKIKEQFSD